MNIFDEIKSKVTAKQAAERYGLEFGRSGRAKCPWHHDRHPDLTFYNNGTCYCFACHNGGDAVSLTCQIFSLKPIEAAKKLNTDFFLRLDLDAPYKYTGPSKIELEREQKRREQERWAMLCDIVRECDKVLNKYSSESDSPEFIEALKNRSLANQELDMMWSEIT